MRVQSRVARRVDDRRRCPQNERLDILGREGALGAVRGDAQGLAETAHAARTVSDSCGVGCGRVGVWKRAWPAQHRRVLCEQLAHDLDFLARQPTRHRSKFVATPKNGLRRVESGSRNRSTICACIVKWMGKESARKTKQARHSFLGYNALFWIWQGASVGEEGGERAVEGAWFDCWARTIGQKTLVTDLRTGVGSVSKRERACVCVCVCAPE